MQIRGTKTCSPHRHRHLRLWVLSEILNGFGLLGLGAINWAGKWQNHYSSCHMIICTIDNGESLTSFSNSATCIHGFKHFILHFKDCLAKVFRKRHNEGEGKGQKVAISDYTCQWNWYWTWSVNEGSAGQSRPLFFLFSDWVMHWHFQTS